MVYVNIDIDEILEIFGSDNSFPLSHIPKESCHSNFTNISIEHSSTFNRSQFYLFFVDSLFPLLALILEHFTLYFVLWPSSLIRMNTVRAFFIVAPFCIG